MSELERQLRQQLQEANERARLAEERADRAEEMQRDVTFLDYLRNLQTTIVPALIVEEDPAKRSSGTVTDVHGKVYPRALRRWDDFPRLCDKQFDAFAETFGKERLFPSLLSVQEAKKNLSPKSRKDEKDIVPFIRAYAERPTREMVNKFITTYPPLQGTELEFSNNAYGLHPKPYHDDGEGLPPPSKKRSSDRPTSLAPDRWGIRIIQESDTETTALVGEYKAAHKLPMRTYFQVLGSDPLPETLFADCARWFEAEPQAGRRPDAESTKVAKVLCQAYHYMIITGLAYGYAASGECMVFLSIPYRTPDVLLVHLCGKTPTSMPSPKQSHAVQLATLSLLALASEPPPAQWILHSERTLPRWPFPKEGRGDHPSGASIAISGDTATSLPPPPPPGNPSASCRGDTTTGNGDVRDDDDDADDHDSTAAIGKRKREGTRPPALPSSHNHGGGCGGGGKTSNESSSHKRGGTHGKQYCTQACLLGLCRGGPLDPTCPNTPVHGNRQGSQSHHRISASELCLRVRNRLARDLDHGCECLDKYGMFGATGVLFTITDPTYGYTFVAKGVQRADASTLMEEAWIYSRCQDLQGIQIPVYLGTIELVNHYPLRSLAVVTHMMFLSWAGTSLAQRSPPAGVDVEAEVDAAVEALRRHGVEHEDIRKANLTWDDQARRIMVIDFHLAFVYSTPKRARIREEGDMTEGLSAVCTA